ncbi:hypothetical protein ACFW5U_29880 [Streptomyces rochei]|uniref:hypothetical protein n=1 Tax=Streptomyces rochei TaxID=1928 RepID=UPI0036B89218
MPFNVKIWVEDRDDGRFNVYVVDSLIKHDGARALEAVLNSTITGWRRLDDSAVRAALRVVNG